MAVITSEERRLVADLITHHERELEICLDMGNNPDKFSPREIARSKDICTQHKRFAERLRNIIADAVVN